WDMEYHRIMGYGCDFPLSQLGKRIFLWVIPGYGLREVCLKRESTVVLVNCKLAYPNCVRAPPKFATWLLLQV
ncbi:hypothetical protein GY45DRAFT_1264438, partial [Cubamyces sp. BRFM 1775]